MRDKIIITIALILIFLFFICFVAYGSLINSFNAGQLGTLLKYRVDLEKQHMGVETLENMIVKEQGAAVRRPGTQYIGTAAATNRLIPFEYTTDDAFVLRFENTKVYFYKDGAAVQAP